MSIFKPYDTIYNNLNSKENLKELAAFKQKNLDAFFNNSAAPTIKEEVWRYSRLPAILTKAYQLAPSPSALSDQQKELITTHPLLKDANDKNATRIAKNATRIAKNATRIAKNATRIVLWNGHVVKEYSDLTPEDGIVVTTFQQILQVDAHQQHKQHLLETLSLFDAQNYFEYLNNILFDNGIFIAIEKNIKAVKPIEVVHISSDNLTANHALFSKTIVYASEGSNISVIEYHLSEGNQANHLVNGSTHFKVEKNAQVNFIHLQKESLKANHVRFNTIHLEEDSKFKSVLLQMGSTNAMEQSRVYFNGEHAYCELNGISLGTQKQVLEQQTNIEHAKANCNSYQFYKSLLKDSARFNFTGQIHVHKDAQKTDAYQMNRNLSLSERNQVNTRPQLVIEADDVKCSHGATIGQLNKEEIFYLQSRGFSKEMAVKILSYAFIEEVLLKIEDQSQHQRIAQAVEKYFYQ